MGEWEMLSNSKAKTWRRCPKQFEFKYVMDLKPKRKKVELERGSWLHDLLMHHYDGQGWRKRHHVLTLKFNKLFEEEREDLGDLPKECGRIMSSYEMNYAEEDRHYRVIDSELDEVITLPNGLRFRMIIDLIVEEPDGGLWIWDHKTVGNFMRADFMLLDAQLARYFWGAQHLGYKPLRGIVFNELITTPPTLPAVLKTGGLTKRKNLKCDVYTYYRELKRLGLEPRDYRDVLLRLKAQNNRWFRRTRLAKDAPLTQRMMDELVMTAKEIKRAEQVNEYPRTPDRSCTWGCSYLELCSLQLMGGDISNAIKMNYEPRKPKDE